MNAVTTTVRRVAYGAGVAALLLSLYGCARERMYAHVESTPEAVISAADAEQTPIPTTRRDSATETTNGDCAPNPSNPGARVECTADGINRAFNSVSPPTR